MREIMNQNSFVLLSLIIVVVSSIFLVRVNVPFNKIWIIFGIVIILFFIGISFRSGNSSVSSTDEVKGMLQGGEPTVVMFYSDY